MKKEKINRLKFNVELQPVYLSNSLKGINMNNTFCYSCMIYLIIIVFLVEDN